MEEKKKLFNSNKKSMALVSSGIVILIIGIVLLIKFTVFKDSDEVAQTEQHVQTEQQINSENFENDENIMKLTATDDTVYGISKSSEFLLTSEKELSEETIIKNLSVEPKKEMKIVKKSSKEFVISFNDEALDNILIKFKYRNGNQYFGWAFQTQKIFGIQGTLPAKSWDVPVNTGIEIYFTKPVSNDIDDYFSIKPYVEGAFEYYDNKVIFIPNNDLLLGTEYTVTISGDYSTNNEKMESNYTFSFSTVSSGVKNTFDFKEINSLLHENGPRGLAVYLYDEKVDEITANVNIYKLLDAESYCKGLNEFYSNNFISNKSDNIDDYITYDEKISFEGEVVSNDVNWYTVGYIEIPDQLLEGYYVVQMEINDSIHYQFLQVSKYNAYAAIDKDQLFIWSIDAGRGVPASNCRVEADNEYIGDTNEDGVLIGAIDSEDHETHFIKISDDNGDSIIVDLRAYEYYWYRNEASYDHSTYNNPIEYWNYLYTDREIYLPNDEINVFGFAQKRNGSSLSSVKVTVEYKDKILDEQVVMLSPIGSFDCKFDISNYLYSWITVKVYDGDTCISTRKVVVGEISVPTYKLEVEKDKEFLMMGDTIEFNTKTTFFEGTPVPNAGVGISTYSFTFDNGKEETNVIADENGCTTTTIKPFLDINSWRPQHCRLMFWSNEYQEYYARNYEDFVLFPRDTMVSLDYDKQSETSVNISVNMNEITLDTFEGNTYDYDSYKGKTVADKHFQITVKESYYEKEFVGQKYDYINKVTYDQYNYKRVTNVIDTYNGVTDEKGQYVLNFNQVIEGRNYTFEISTEDTKGMPISEAISYSNEIVMFDGYLENLWGLEIDTDKWQYKTDENIEISLAYMNYQIADTEKNFAMYITCKAGFIDYKLSNNLNENLTFTKDYIPNAYVVGVYFDGTHLFRPKDKSIGYNTEEVKLNTLLSTDKADYLPGDMVTIDIVVTDDKGKPIVADVNLNIVDEALLSIYPNKSDILQKLYGHIFPKGILGERIITSINLYDNKDCMAERGGGDGANYIRDDFEFTAEFNTITTDASGRGSISFELPDNLTSWRISARAITDNLKAGQNEMSINCKLPFFVDLIIFDNYMAKDTVEATLRTIGTAVNEEMDIKYKVILEDEKGNTNETLIDAKGLEYVSADLGQLEKGIYTVTVYATSDSFNDGISQQLEVVDTMQYFEVRKEEKLSEDIDFVTNDNIVQLAFINKDSAWHYNNIYNIYHNQFSKRIDILAAAYTAGNYLNNTYNSELNVDFMGNIEKYIDSGIFKELTYSSESAETTAYVLMTDVYKDGLLSEDEINLMASELNYMRSDYYSTEENFSAMLGLAILNQPVLLDIYEWMDSDLFLTEDLSFEKLYVLLSLIEVGDLEKARTLYDELYNQYSINSGTGIKMEDGEKSRKHTALMMMASVKLGKMNDADAFYQYLSKGKDVFFPTIIEQLTYLMAKVPVETTCSFNYDFNNEQQTVKLDYNDVYYLDLLADEADRVSFSDIEGNVTVLSEFIGTVNEVEVSEDIQVTRTYKVNGEVTDTSSIKQGDIVEVKIDVNCDNRYCLEINDVLPAGLVFKENKYDDMRYAYYDVHGSMVDIYGYADESGHFSASYYAVAVGKGEYSADYVVVKNRYGVDLNYGDSEKIIIE